MRVAVASSGRLGVDVGSALNLIGTFVAASSVASLFPLAVALGYGEAPWPFLVGGASTLALGLGLVAVTQGRERVGFREGFLVVALTWLLIPALGSIPYLVAGEAQLARPVDALFESMSGFTATGSTVVTDLDELSRSLLMWRQFTQWVGGMGIVVLALAILPRLRVGGRQLFQSELAGPTELERLTASIRDTAQRLWLLYLGLTGLAIVVLATIGWTGLDEAMSPYDAVAHAFSSIAIGGFSTENRSLEAFSAATQWAIAAFVVIAGINFLRLYRAVVLRQPRAVSRDQEFRVYVGALVVGALLLLVELLASGTLGGEAAVRHAVFQSVSIMTTAGFASTDYAAWGALAQLTLLALMFVGASAGSTGGSIKVIRHVVVAKVIRRELDQAVHRELVQPIRMGAGVVDERLLRSVMTFVLLYLAIFAAGAIGLVIDARVGNVEVSAFDALGASAAALGNVGPAFGFAGPMGSYAPFSDASTGILTALMWLGRLEIVPVVVLLTRAHWRA
ncbi:MAG: TrkH family potassium uptake protein [Thermoleophilia bacterium]